MLKDIKMKNKYESRYEIKFKIMIRPVVFLVSMNIFIIYQNASFDWLTESGLTLGHPPE